MIDDVEEACTDANDGGSFLEGNDIKWRFQPKLATKELFESAFVSRSMFYALLKHNIGVY